MAKTKVKAKRSARKPNSKPGNPVVRLVRWVVRSTIYGIWWLGLRLTLLGTAGMAAWIGYYYVQLPPMEDLLDGRSGGSVILLDRNYQVFAWRGEQFDGSLRAGSVSPFLKDAVIATEDKRFYRHLGISPRGIASAIRINLSEGRGPFSGHGGSTITQQVAKLLCLGQDRLETQTQAEYEAECRRSSMARKIMEVPYSIAMELKYSKDDILSIYMNRAFLGAGAYGFEAASQRYFAKSAVELNLSEAAMLAGLLTAPSRFAPTGNLERAQERAATVIRLMLDQGYITAAQAADATANPAVLSTVANERVGEYFADWVMQDAPSFLTRDTTEDVEIRTTLDRDLQRAAEAALLWVFENRVKEGSEAEAAIIIMSPDGAVRAMVGGRNINGAGLFNRATQALRQPGSSFKPFVYAAALQAGMHPFDLVHDGPFCVEIPRQPDYCPENYTRQYYGDLRLVDAMANSLNTVALQLSEMVGREKVRAMAQDFGINTQLAEGPSIALGVSEVNLLELTGAYAGILNGGYRTTPYGWIDLRLRGDDDILMEYSQTDNYRVLSETADAYLIYMMSQVVANGSGQRAILPDGRPAAGKTGTTQEARDAWFVGFTADYVTGVWMGYDDNTPLTGVTGGGLPAEIWHETMVRVHEGLPIRPLPMIDPTSEPPRIQPGTTDPLVDDIERSLLESIISDIFGSGN